MVTPLLIGNTQMNVDKVVQFAKDEGIELNCKKCMEMIIIDFRKNISLISPNHIMFVVNINVSRTKSYKLLGIRLYDDFKWNFAFEGPLTSEAIAVKATLNM